MTTVLSLLQATTLPLAPPPILYDSSAPNPPVHPNPAAPSNPPSHSYLSSNPAVHSHIPSHSNPLPSRPAAAPVLPTLAPFVAPAVPRYVQKYPFIYDAVSTLPPLIQEWTPATPAGAYELECRLGQWQGDHFQSGVSKPLVERILALFDTFAHWSKVTGWEETHDYFYINDPSLPTVRTTASFRTDAQTGRKRIDTAHIRKYPRAKADFRYVSAYASDFRYDLRVSLTYEAHVSEQELPAVVNPTSVRIKSRKSFYYKSEDFPAPEPLWRFDITRSWCGPDRSQAEWKQRQNDTTYEVELECLNPRALMVTPQHDAFYVACSMLLKMKDLISSDVEFKWEPLGRPVAAPPVSCF